MKVRKPKKKYRRPLLLIGELVNDRFKAISKYHEFNKL